MAIKGNPSEDAAFGLRIKLWVEDNIKVSRHKVLEGCNNMCKGP